jgi:hypothetical protein
MRDSDRLEVVASSRTDFTDARRTIISPADVEELGTDDPLETKSNSVLVAIYVPASESAGDAEDADQAAALHGLWHHQMYFKVRVLDVNADKSGVFSTRNDAWTTASNCGDSEYLSTHPEDGIGNDGKPDMRAEARPLFAGLDSQASKDTPPACVVCPEGGNCAGDKTWDETTNQDGWASLPWDARGFGRCPQPQACPGGIPVLRLGTGNRSNLSSAECLVGHTGDLCANCIPGYTVPLAGGNETCTKCPNPVQNYLALSGLGVVATLVIAFLVYDSLDGINDIIKSVEKHKNDDNRDFVDTQIPFHSVGIRIISSYLQVAGLLRNFQITLPPSVKTLSAVQGAASGIGGQVIAFPCLLPNLRGGDLFFVRQIATIVCLPVLMMVCVVLFWTLRARFLKCKNKDNTAAGKARARAKAKARAAEAALNRKLGNFEANIKHKAKAKAKAKAETKAEALKRKQGHYQKVTIVDKATGSLVVLFYLMFPSIMTSVTSMLQCTSFGTANDRSGGGSGGDEQRDFQVETRILLDAELSIECYESVHMMMVGTVAVPGLIVFVVIVPLMLVVFMRRHAKRGEMYPQQENFSPAVSYRYGFLFLGYEDSTYAWEILVMVRKASFVVAAGFLRAYGPVAQVIGAVCILVLSLSLHLQYTPYECEGHDRMESLSLHSSLLILLIVLMSATVNGGDDQTLGELSTIVVIAGVFGATLCFFAVSNWLILTHSHQHPGVLGAIAKRCTKPARVKLALQRTPLQKNSTGRKQSRLKKKRTITYTDVQKAVVHHKVRGLEKEYMRDRQELHDAVLVRQASAKARLKVRVQQRKQMSETTKTTRKKKNKQKTKKTTAVAPSGISGDNLPQGWSEVQDKSTGRPYFYNHTTKASSWERPVA